MNIQQAIASVQPVSEIQAQLDCLALAVANCAETCGALSSRIDPVLKPATPSLADAKNSDATGSMGPSTQVGMAIADATSRINRLQEAVADLMRRIAL